MLIQNAEYTKPVYKLFFFFLTLAFTWFEGKSLFGVLVSGEEKLNFELVVKSISDS